MVAAEIFRQFQVAQPDLCELYQSPTNKFGFPLNPSGMYAFWKWQEVEKFLAPEIANALCTLLVLKFGEAVKDGNVTSWQWRAPKDSISEDTTA
jgi:hypothetical protein